MQTHLVREVALRDFYPSRERANYGAQILGRAIGHEDPHLSGDPARIVMSGYGDIVTAAGFGPRLNATIWIAAYNARDGF